MARSFNGTTDYISLGHAITYANGSMAIWVRLNGSPANNDVVVGQNSAVDGNMGCGIQLRATGSMYVAVAGTITGFSATTLPTTGGWAHIGMSWGGGGLKGYIDGAEEVSNATTAAADVTATYVLEMGAFNYSGGRVLFPAMDTAEFGIWDAALTADEWVSLAKGLSPSRVRPASLTSYLPLIGRASPEQDLMGLGAGTLSGTAYSTHPRIIYHRRARTHEYTAAAAGSTIGLLRANAGLRWGPFAHANAGVGAI